MSKLLRTYDNIFHSFRGNEEVVQNENNITKALINVFEHSHIDLINNFFTEELKLINNSKNNIKFDLQIKKSLESNFKKAFVLGISDEMYELENKSDTKEENSGVPDAVIISEDLCILIEVKVRNAKITDEQIKRHERLFNDEQTISPPIFKTWNDILRFLEIQKDILFDDKYSVTRFLLNQFIDFCAINGIGPNKSKDFYLMCFPLNIRPLAKEIDNYIFKKYETELDLSKQAKSGGISYTRKGKRGFFAKLESNAHMLILSLDSFSGVKMQRDLSNLGFDKKQKKKSKAWATPDREAWIDLSKVRYLHEIKQFIDEAFNKRP